MPHGRHHSRDGCHRGHRTPAGSVRGLRFRFRKPCRFRDCAAARNDRAQLRLRRRLCRRRGAADRLENEGNGLCLHAQSTRPHEPFFGFCYRRCYRPWNRQHLHLREGPRHRPERTFNRRVQQLQRPDRSGGHGGARDARPDAGQHHASAAAQRRRDCRLRSRREDADATSSARCTASGRSCARGW